MTTYQAGSYRQTAVMGSTPQRLVPVLYEHLLVNVKRGILHIERGDIEGKFTSLARAADIVAELMAALDFETGGELSERLQGLYAYWLREIGSGGRELDTTRLERVAGMVSSLLEAWERAARLVEVGDGGLVTAEGPA